MKLTAITTAIAIATLLGTHSLTNAQDAPTARTAPSPGSINASNKATTPSGSESQAAATGSPKRVIGSQKYCTVLSGRNRLDCVFASLTRAGNVASRATFLV